ncbi:MAG: aldehyde dehydrogenase [Acidobacteria bacterium]|nr:aldehyde dehydrogenase [Acidobacteriota bacterium]
MAKPAKLRNYIGGELVAPASSRYLEVVEPATGLPLLEAPDSAEQDVAQAVAAAADAFPGWSATPAAERSRLLLDIAARIEARIDELARDESRDSGKPLVLARSVDIPRAVANFRFFATAILHDRSEFHATDRRAINYTLRRPRGVAGLISPWNLPLYLLSWKVAPALATGNTAVAKPSELTPLTAFRLSEICREAGLPAGVLNIVHGLGRTAGAALVAEPRVGTISFTGGTATGREIARAAAPQFKKVALEMGGKNPFVVFADADLEAAVQAAVRAAFSNQGQICLCGSRLLVERPVYDRFTEQFVAATRRLIVGNPLDPATDQGALVSRTHLDKVRSYIQLARAEGGHVLCGGDRPASLPAICRDGFFLEPTVIAGLDAACRVNQEEIFGPVVTLLPFDDEDEALAIANGTPYGLAASLWTGNLARAHRLAQRLDTGILWINCWMLRDLRVPFGGVKQSGLGREGGEEALRFFTEPTSVCIQVEP